MVASIYGPLSAAGIHFSSESVEPVSGKSSTLSSCKRRLMFTQRIFQGEAVYLDLRTPNGSRQRAALEADLTALGAKVEAFLSKEVTHVVTDRNDTSSTPSNGSQSSPAAGAGRDGPLRGAKASPAVFSRAQALLNRSVSKQQQQQLKTNAAAADPVSLAKQWGIRVTPLKKVLCVIEKEKSKCDPNRKLSGSRHTSKGTVRVRKLEGAFIKVEDESCQYRPSSKNFASFPVIDLMDPAICHNQSPFNLRRKSLAAKQLENHSGMGKVEVGAAQPDQVVREKPHTKEVHERTPSTKQTVKKVPKSGFCEVCDTTYTNLREHTRSDSHQRFAMVTDNFRSLDDIISNLPSLANLQTDFANMTLSAEEEANMEVELDLNQQQCLETKDVLMDMKTDLNNGILSDSEKGLQTPKRPLPCAGPIETVPKGSVDSSLCANSMALDFTSRQQMTASSQSPKSPAIGPNVERCGETKSKAGVVSDPAVEEHPELNAAKDVDDPSKSPQDCLISCTASDDSPEISSTQSKSVSPTETENVAFSKGESREKLSNESTSNTPVQRSETPESQFCSDKVSQKGNAKIDLQPPVITTVENVQHTENELDEVLLLTPLKPRKSVSEQMEIVDVEKAVGSPTMPKLTPQKTPLKNFTPVKYSSEIRVLSESAVQAVLKELNFLNTNCNPASDIQPATTTLSREDPPLMEYQGPSRVNGGGSQDIVAQTNEEQTQGHSVSSLVSRGSESLPSMPELCAEVAYDIPQVQLLDIQSNDATMPEPLSSRGSYFDVSPVKLITQFSFGCLQDTNASNASSRPDALVANKLVVENYSMHSWPSEALLPDSVPGSKSYPTSFSNILSGISASSSQTSKTNQECENTPIPSPLLDKTIIEDKSNADMNIGHALVNTPEFMALDSLLQSGSKQTQVIESTISQNITTEPMEFSDISSDHVENSIAQNLLARLQDQGFASSDEESENDPSVLLHYNGDIQQQIAGSDTLAQAAKDLVDVDNVFCGETVVCDSRSTATMHAPLDIVSHSPDSCSSVIPMSNAPSKICDSVTQETSSAVLAPGLPVQKEDVESAPLSPALNASANVSVPDKDLSEPDVSEHKPDMETCPIDVNQNKYVQRAELSVAKSEVQAKEPAYSLEHILTFSGYLSNCPVNTAVKDDNTESVPQQEETSNGGWSPSMILNPVNLWWQQDTAKADSTVSKGISMVTKGQTSDKIHEKPVTKNSYQLSPSKVKVVATKAHKKSKKSKRDKEHSSKKAKSKSQMSVESETVSEGVSTLEGKLSHKRKSHKHKSKKSKVSSKSPISPSVKPKKHKSKKSKTERSETRTPKVKDVSWSPVTPKGVNQRTAPGDCSTPKVTWTVTPSRGLKIKLCKVITPLQENKTVAGETNFDDRAGCNQTMDMAQSSKKHKHKKTKLDKDHRRRKLDL